MHYMKASCCGSQCCGPKSGRNFLTKEEKIEMLKEHQQFLEKEAQGVKEKIKHLENEK